jgi:hypothetical protein
VYGYLTLAAVLGTATILLGITWVAIVAQTALCYPVLWRDLKRSDLGGALRHMLFWAAVVSLCTIEVSIHARDLAAVAIPRGESYRIEMFEYIERGVGAENSPHAFLPQHALHFLATLGASVLTAGLGGLFLGSVLLGYMNYYVGALVNLGADPLFGSLFGWPIWSMFRVAGFIMGAIAMAHLTHARLLRRSGWDGPGFRQLLLWSVTLAFADVVLKAFLAEPWRAHLLERALLP